MLHTIIDAFGTVFLSLAVVLTTLWISNKVDDYFRDQNNENHRVLDHAV